MAHKITQEELRKREELEKKLEIYDFWDIFRINEKGSLSPKHIISLAGIIFGPGVGVRPGVRMGGVVDIYDYYNCRVGVIREDNGVLKIQAFYPPNK